MILQKTDMEGLVIIENKYFRDTRGGFLKVLNKDFFEEARIDFKVEEFYFSVSAKNVIRGMHFQLPPFDCAKLVSVSKGALLDVAVDLRRGSGTYGKYFSTEIRAGEGKSLYIPSGFAHGFKSLEDGTVMNYLQSAVYNQECDTGIRYDSFGFDWGVENPILSGRDAGFIGLEEFKSPF